MNFKAMNFKTIIEQNAENPKTRDNTISDGTNTHTYAQLPDIFNSLDPPPQHTTTLAPQNNLPDTLTLLWLLHRQCSVLLLPPAARGPSRTGFIEKNIFEKPPPLDHPEKLFIKGTRLGGAVLMRTSGSTADPKMVRHSEEKLYNNALNCTQRFNLTPNDRVLIPVPIYHMYGLGAGLLPAIIAGASIQLLADTNIIKYMDATRQFKPTTALLTPTLIEMLLRIQRKTHQYRLTITAGDRIAPNTFTQFQNTSGTLLNLYGSTELGAIAVSTQNTTPENHTGETLKPLPNVQIKFEKIQPEENQDTNTLAILCQHPHGFDTYIDKQGNQIKGTDPNGWFHTGDLGRPTNNGFNIVGRTGNSTNRNGILTAFAEVEALMEQHIPQIQHAVITTAKEKDRFRGQKMIAICTLKSNKNNPKNNQKNNTPDENTIRNQCKKVMPKHMVPDQITIIPEIPKLPNGKIHRKKIQEIINNKKEEE